MIDTRTKTYEYERQPGRETERKFLPLFPEELVAFRDQAVPVEQYYLSHYGERFSLRLRETFTDGGPRYSAAFKNDGELTSEGLDRIEEETEIGAATYALLKTPDVPVLRKLRASPSDHIAIDFFEDGYVQLESEDQAAWERFASEYGLVGKVMEISGDDQAKNEWRAHALYVKTHGNETLRPAPELELDGTMRQIMEASRTGQTVRVRIGGRSGSGKSTLIRELTARLHEHGIAPTVLSTDDYNIGRNALTARFGTDFNWDMREAYDTRKLADDLERLGRGEPVARQAYDFGSGEPSTDGYVMPSGVYLIEGLYALSPDLASPDVIDLEIPTSFAECAGRRLYRDHYSGERDVSATFPTAADSLRYMLEIAEPAYRAQRS